MDKNLLTELCQQPDGCQIFRRAGRCLRCSRLVAVLLVLGVSWRGADARIRGFAESFNGQGQYPSIDGAFDGLDNPGWALAGVGMLTDEGYKFDIATRGEDIVIEIISRLNMGEGGFLHQWGFKELSLGEKTNDFSAVEGGIVLEHYFTVGDLSSRVRVVLREPADPDDAWDFALSTTTPPIQGERAFVARGSNPAMGLRYDPSSLTFSATYDDDIADGKSPIELTLPVRMELSAESEVRLNLQSSGENRVSGILSSWSLTPISDVLGDFNGNELLDAADIDLLSEEVRAGKNTASFDLNADALVNDIDRQVWVHDLKQTYFGDSDLNGLFDSTDLVQVLAFGEYEDEVPMNSTWVTGDWDGDGDFTSSNLVLALADGGYDAITRQATHSVPEPLGSVPMFLAFATLLAATRRPCYSALSP